MKLGIASGLLVLLSAGVIVSREMAMQRIDAATVETERQAAILRDAEQVGIMLGRIRVNATEMRLSFANLENDELLRKVKTDIDAAQARLDHLL
ncbi:MAG: hypothetical protein B7Y84_19810, partial [Azorhizobium sp. 32-67-21]